MPPGKHAAWVAAFGFAARDAPGSTLHGYVTGGQAYWTLAGRLMGLFRCDLREAEILLGANGVVTGI